MALWRTNGHRPVVHAGISAGTSGAESRSSAYSIKRMTGVEVTSAFYFLAILLILL